MTVSASGTLPPMAPGDSYGPASDSDESDGLHIDCPATMLAVGSGYQSGPGVRLAVNRVHGDSYSRVSGHCHVGAWNYTGVEQTLTGYCYCASQDPSCSA